MKNGSNHIVQKMRYAIAAHGPASQSLGLNQELSDFHSRQASGLYEEIFNLVDNPQEHMIIDALEIDLGIIAPENWQKEFARRLKYQLAEQLSVLCVKIGVNLSRDFSFESKTQKPEDQQIDHLSESAYDWMLFRHFLEHGYFPWSASQTEAPSPAGLAKKLIPNSEKQLLDVLKRQKTHHALLRLLELAEHHGFLMLLMRKLALSPSEAASIQNLCMQLVPEDIFVNTRWKIVSLKAILIQSAFLLKRSEKEITAEIRKNYQAFLDHLPNSKIAILDSYLKEGVDVASDSLSEAILHVCQQLLTQRVETAKTKDISETEKVRPAISPQEREDEIHDKAEMLASNCGLFITWPYLKGLFSALGLLNEEGGFVTPDEQIKAIHLLYYLARSESALEEQELLIPKIICAWPIEEPLPTNVELLENETAECMNMLQALIDNWTILKSTSVQSLQTTFLQRSGLVSYKNRNLEIRIERIGLDVIMDKLPYGLSIIRFPWLDKTIYCSW